MTKTISTIATMGSMLALLGAGCVEQPQPSNQTPAAPTMVPSVQPSIAPSVRPSTSPLQTKPATTVSAPPPKPTPTPTPKPAPIQPQVHRVSINNFSFQPSLLSIKVGDTIIWHQSDSAPHSVVLGDGTASPILQQGQEYSHTFTGPGTFNFHCGIHPSMTGAATVQ